MSESTPSTPPVPTDAIPETVFSIEEILNILPHRYPFLLIDRIVELRDKFVVAIKCVTMNEWFFQGHFPQKPVMPGVLILEAMAQTGAAMVHRYPENEGKLIFLAGIDDARFRRMVQPGDVLRIEVTEVLRRRGIGRSVAKAYVGSDLACEATITFMAER